MLALRVYLICSITISFAHVHIEHEQLSPNSHDIHGNSLLNQHEIKLTFMNNQDINCWQIFIELIVYRQLTPCVSRLAGDPLGSRGPRLKPT